MNSCVSTRREMLKKALLGSIALPLLGSVRLSAADAANAAPSDVGVAPPEGREHGLRLGMASYSIRVLPMESVIPTAKTLRMANVSLFRLHFPWETASVDDCRALGARFKEAGLAITGSGVINLPNDEAKLRKIFDNAKAAGLATMMCKPSIDAFPLIDRLVKEYDQKIAIHNHGPEDEVYPTAASAMKHIDQLDARIGLCIDVGHSYRASEDPATAIRTFAARVHDIHMKDSVAVPGALRDIPVEGGQGRIDFPGIFKALLAIRYNGVVTYEYERNTPNPVSGLAESMGYARGVLKMLASA